MNRAVFLDRDGTLNIEKSYLFEPNKLELFDGALVALKRLGQAGFLLFIVTNQSGIGRGYYTEQAMHTVHHKLRRLAAAEQVTFQQIYFAPEAPEAPSIGRKPSPHFLQDAAQKHAIELAKSFMIGDKLTDLQCGWNAGVQKSLLVKTGYGEKLFRQPNIDLSRAVIVENLTEAADYILAH